MSFIRELVISLPILIIVVILSSHLVVVPTGSMTPVISEGDVVLIENVDVLGLFKEFNPGDVKIGDIILYNDSNSSSNGEYGTVIHRVVAINESEGKKNFTLKGDANSAADDGNVYPEQVTSRVLTWGGNPITIPKVGWIILWFKGGTS
jgi:signal peptidase